MKSRITIKRLKKNSKGFIATSLIYSFFLAILLLMTLTVNNYYHRENINLKMSDKVKEKINNTSPEYNTESGIMISLGNYLQGIIGDTYSPGVITKPAPEGESCTNTFIYDGTSDNNLRYVGANPCNYVNFSGELWRIIGVMNNVDNGYSRIQVIKIVRAQELGTNFSWDTSAGGTGSNDWTQADLMQELRTDYLDFNEENDKYWYNGENNQKTGVFDHSLTIKIIGQKYFIDVNWPIGGYVSLDISATDMYNNEKSGNVYSGNPTEWNGLIALPSLSDLAFANGDVSTCQSNILNTYSQSSCYNNNWFFSLSNNKALLLNPVSNSPSKVFNFSKNGIDATQEASTASAVLPTLYLGADTLYISGNGSINKPYTIGQKYWEPL